MLNEKKRVPKFSRIDADVRRRSLIEATLRCLARDGIEGTTVRRICQEANVSAGLLRHYYDGKNDLISKTYDAMAGNFARITNDALKAPSVAPERRLHAFFETSFTPDFISADVLLAWTAFWRLIRSDRRLQDMHRQVYASYRNDLEEILAEIAAKSGNQINPRLAALSLTGLMDGLWLEISLDPSAFTPAEAIEVCRNWLDSFTGQRHIGRFENATHIEGSTP
jgi:TetR/AcrR family transcriptional regulator, transcriptional repressor of bet genes